MGRGASKTVEASCYLTLEPSWDKHSTTERVSGLKVVRVSQRAPKKGYCIKINIEVPKHVFKPVIAEVDVKTPERAVQCKVDIVGED